MSGRPTRYPPRPPGAPIAVPDGSLYAGACSRAERIFQASNHVAFALGAEVARRAQFTTAIAPATTSACPPPDEKSRMWRPSASPMGGSPAGSSGGGAGKKGQNKGGAKRAQGLRAALDSVTEPVTPPALLAQHSIRPELAALQGAMMRSMDAITRCDATISAMCLRRSQLHTIWISEQL